MRQGRPLLLGLGLLSAAMLAFEIGLTRLFAVQQFFHFAFLVVGLAVMGVAAGGLALALRPRPPSLSRLAALFGLAVPLAYGLINGVPFDSYSVAWDPRQLLVLALTFLAAAVPFLLAGWATAAALAAAGQAAHRPYAAVLAGSALGGPLALGAHALGGSAAALALAGALGWAAAASFAAGRQRLALLLPAAALLGLGLRPPPSLWPTLSPYKPLALARLIPDARLTLTRWSASARLDVVESRAFHQFPGLSLGTSVPLPDQAALFLDGDGPWPVTALSPDDPQAAQLARRLPSGLAYLLRPGARALILEPGAGTPALVALALGASHVDLPTDEPLVLEVLQGPYAAFTHHLLRDPRVRALPRAGRGALRGGERYQVVEFALSDPFRPVTSGAFSLTEDYTLTVEAFADAYDRLTEDGLLVVTRWLGTPPSESARAWATLLAALRARGLADPSAHLVAYRSMRTATLLAARGPFTAGELAQVRAFLEANGFDPVYLPDLRPEELNRHNRLPEEVYHALFLDLLRRPEATLLTYDFNLAPPTDDRPFFFHFFRWRQTPEVLAQLGLLWQPFGGSGYLVLLALLALTLLLAVPMALAPLAARAASRPGRPALAYFACLGAGFLLVEIPLIQRLTLLLDRPAPALATVLFVLLLASGVGSELSPRLSLERALGALLLLLAALALALPAVVRLALPWPLPARLLVAAGLLAPPGVLMGVPFAAGLRRLEARAPGWIPWAWAVNGAVSGVSGVVAAMVALDLGTTAVLVLGALAYAGARLAAPALSR